MSQVYSTEPSTTGRVVLQTTHGAIDINLWCKECPTATRTFLQLCLDGYYNDLPFHRIVNDFLIQSGDAQHRISKTKENSEEIISYMNRYVPMGCWKSSHGRGGGGGGGTEEGSASAWLARKRLELNPRIKFNHRGQIAMALPLDADLSDENNDLESEKDAMSLARQFFITLDEAPFLTGKHVVFGTISGDTIFNAIRMGKTEVEEGDLGKPVEMEHGPRIKSVKIAHHIFDDLVLTKEDQVPWKKEKKDEGSNALSDVKKRRKKRKGKKDLNVLSFGAEMEEEEGDISGVGMISSHDIKKENPTPNKKEKNNERGDKKKRKKQERKERNEDKDEPVDTASEIVTESETNDEKQMLEEENSSQKEDETISLQSSLEKASKILAKMTSETNDTSLKATKSKEKKTPGISAVEARRAKYLSKRQSQKLGSKKRDIDTMSRLSSFKSKVLNIKGIDEHGNAINNDSFPKKDNSLAARMLKRSELEKEKSSKMESLPTYSGQILEDDDKDLAAANNGSWLKTQFRCKRHIDHDSKDQSIGGDGRNIDEYEVIDEKRRKKEHREPRNSKHRRR